MTKIDHRHENSGRFPFTEAKAGSRQNLIKARLSAGMSQDQVAEQIGCSQEQYSLIESNRRNGKRYWSKLEILFGVPTDVLMAIDHSEPDWSEYLRRSHETNQNVDA